MSIENNTAQDKFEQELEDEFFGDNSDDQYEPSARDFISDDVWNEDIELREEFFGPVDPVDAIADEFADELEEDLADQIDQDIAEQVAQAVQVAEQIAHADEPSGDQSELVNGKDRVAMDEGFEDAFIGAMDRETKESITNINLLNKLLGSETDAEQRKVIEENLNKEKNFIRRKDAAEFQQWKAWAKEREYNPKAPSPDDTFLQLLKELGMSKKNNFNISFSGMGFNVIDNATKKVVLQKKSGRCLINRNQVNEKTVSLALLSVGQKSGKAVWVYEPKPNSHTGTEAYYRTVIEAAIKLHADGKIKTQLDDIKIGNAHYKYILDEYKDKYSQNATIGAENKSLNSNEQSNGAEQLPETRPLKSDIEKHVFDSTYNLEKAVEKTINRVKLSTSFSKASTARGTLNAISDIMNNKPYVPRAMTKSDFATIKAFVDLNNEMNEYKAQMGKMENITPEIERNLKIIETLQNTGFNPYGKNKKVGLMLTDTATLSMKKVLKSLEVLDSNIRRGEDLGYTSSRYNKSANVFKERLALFSELKTAVKNKDTSKLSERADVVSGYVLNKVLHKKGGRNIFPDTAKVTKVTLSGESIDMYFFEGKNGSVYEVKGTGNKYSKPELSSFTMKQIANLRVHVELDSGKLDLTAKPDPVPEPAKPEQAASPAAAPVVASPVPESTKAANAPVDKVETFTIQGERNKPDFDMTFKNGVCVRDGVAYYVAGEVNEKSVLDDIKNQHPDILQIKKLPAVPAIESEINNAEMKYNNEKNIVDGVWITPTSRGFLLHTYGSNTNVAEIKEAIKEVVKLNNIDIERVNGAFTLKEFNNDIRDIKSRDNYESDFKVGYIALLEVKAESKKVSRDQSVEFTKPIEPELPVNDPVAQQKVRNRQKVSV